LNNAAHELIIKSRKVIALQIGIGVLAAAGFFVGQGPWFALSAGYGMLISIVLAFLLSRGVVQAGNAQRPNQGAAKLYIGAAVRFVLVLLLLVVGLAIFKLDALACVVGFGVTQLAYAFMFSGRERINN